MIHFITTESFSKGCNSIWVAKHSECFIMDNGPNMLAYVSNQKKRKDTKAAVELCSQYAHPVSPSALCRAHWPRAVTLQHLL